VRALITGSGGFVGPWLTAHLEAQGDEVIGIDAEVDVVDPDAIGRVVAEVAPQAIYHLAALSHVGESWSAPAAVIGVNVVGTANVLASARASVPEATVLFVSSAEVYGAVDPVDLPLEEAAPVAPLTPYAASKAAAEQIVLQGWRGYGQRVLVARPFNHIGPGQSPQFAVSALARRIVEAKRAGSHTLTVGTLSTRRDFTDVRDVVRAYRLMVTGGSPGAIYNVASGRAAELTEVTERLLALAGADLELVVDPTLVRPAEVPALEGSSARLSAATGWKPEIPLDTTLSEVLSRWEADDAEAPG
jgi:GDP-4-dehydro-6-deoxy-D-mannose reductase